MENILPSMEDLIQQRLADIRIQIQELKWEQNKYGNNKNLSNPSFTFNIYICNSLDDFYC